MRLLKASIYSLFMMLALSSNSFADCTYELFTISSTKDTKIVDFVNQLSDECGFSVIVTDPYADKYLNQKLNKINLKNLTVEEILDIILSEHNLTYTLQGNILKISYLITKTFNIDYILSQRKSTGSTDVTLTSTTSQSSSTDTTTTTTKDQPNSGMKIESSDQVEFWANLDTEFQNILNRPQDRYKAGKPIINKNAGLVTVTATNKQITRLEDYLNKLQKKVQLQVLIDVQILSVTMSDAHSTGIDWKQLYALQNIALTSDIRAINKVTASTDGVITTASNTAPDFGAELFTLKASGSLSEVIKFLQTQGDVHAISNPKVLTLNNQPALITAGTEYFYKILQSTTQSGTNGGIAATTQNEDIQSVFSGVLLSITPEISDDKTITLKINPSLSETATDISGTSNANRVMPPDLNRRQLSSVVTIKDGNRVILGGLINSKNTVDNNQVPILGSIPLLGYMFKREEKVKTTQEIVIIMQPHIIHKEKKSISLSELGYEGLKDELLVLSPDKNVSNKK